MEAPAYAVVKPILALNYLEEVAGNAETTKIAVQKQFASSCTRIC